MHFIPKGVALMIASAALALPAGLSRPAFAQTTAAAQAPSPAADPAEPKALVPPLVYSSVLQAYRPNIAAEPGAWKARNEQVARNGGWRVDAKEGRQANQHAGQQTDWQTDWQTDQQTGWQTNAAVPHADAASAAAGTVAKPLPAGHIGHKVN